MLLLQYFAPTYTNFKVLLFNKNKVLRKKKLKKMLFFLLAIHTKILGFKKINDDIKYSIILEYSYLNIKYSLLH